MTDGEKRVVSTILEAIEGEFWIAKQSEEQSRYELMIAVSVLGKHFAFKANLCGGYISDYTLDDEPIEDEDLIDELELRFRNVLNDLASHF